jgi:repressor LexA
MFSEIFKAKRKEKGLTQKEIAPLLMVSQQTIASWENGTRMPSHEVMVTVADFFGVSMDLLTGRKHSKPAKKSNRIPVYGNIAAGIPIEAIVDYDPDNADDWEEISEELARNGAHIALRIKGNSMEPRMRTGDVVIVRVQPNVENGDIAAVRVNGDEVTCKKISKTADGIMLIPLNPDYETKFYSAEQIAVLPVCIIGKVVELRAKF